MARVIEAVAIFKKVEDVTSAKDDPPPVYLMDELADMARGSFESSEKVANRIGKRLENKSPVVKYKALRLTRHIANKGGGHFQRAMQKHAAAVRALMHFKGEPDPFKGDTPNQRVRDAAKEAAEALSNTVMTQPVNSLGSRIQGFGSSAAPAPSANVSNNSQYSGGGGSGGGGSGAASSSRMIGFGSSGSTGPASTSNGGPAGNGFGFGSSQRGVNRPLTGGYGGDAGGGGAGHSSGGGYGGGYSAPTVAATDVLGSEEQLVESICTPGGLRLAPDPDDLRRFVEAVGSLDGLRVAELLRDKMDGSGPWQQLLRALYALEAVLLQGATQACGEIAVMFQSDPAPVQAAAASPQAPVRERAGQVLKLLLGDNAAAAAAQQPTPTAAGRTSAAPPPQGAAPAVDLLGGLDMLGSPVQANYSAQPGPQQQAPMQPQQRPEGILSNLTFPLGAPGAQQQPLQAQQQPYEAQRAVPAGNASQGQALDPFAASVAPHIAAPSAQPGAPAYQQLQPGMQQQLPQNGPGLPAGMGPIGAPTSAPRPAYGSARPPAVQAPAPPRSMAAPLDDLFSDMSLSGAGPTAAGGQAGPGAAYGAARAAYGPGAGAAPFDGSGNAYGGPAGRVGTSGVATPNSYASASGKATPVMGGSKPGSKLDLLGMGGSGAAAVSPSTQYGAPYGGAMGMGIGGMSGPQPPLHGQQPAARSPVPGPIPGAAGGGDLLGGFGAGLRSGPSAAGPSAGFGNAGAGYGVGMGMGAGGGGMGMGPGPSASGGMAGGTAMGIGMPMGGVAGMGASAGVGGGMMVGPGGQVRYVGGPGQAPGGTGQGYTGYGVSAGVGPGPSQAAGQFGPMSGSWQQPYGAAQPMAAGQQHLHAMGAGTGAPQQQQQQQQRGSAAFDFVMDQFK